MAQGRVHLSAADVRDLAAGALRGIGYDADEARIIADHVIDAAPCGHEYSGLAKILDIAESEHFKLQRRPMKVLRQTGVSIAFDGGNNVRMLSLFYAAEATIKKAAAHGTTSGCPLARTLGLLEIFHLLRVDRGNLRLRERVCPVHYSVGVQSVDLGGR